MITDNMIYINACVYVVHICVSLQETSARCTSSRTQKVFWQTSFRSYFLVQKREPENHFLWRKEHHLNQTSIVWGSSSSFYSPRNLTYTKKWPYLKPETSFPKHHFGYPAVSWLRGCEGCTTSLPTWRIIPVSKKLVSPIYKPFIGCLEGVRNQVPYFGDEIDLTICYENQLQVMGDDPPINWNNPKRIGETPRHQGTIYTYQSLGSWDDPQSIIISTQAQRRGWYRPQLQIDLGGFGGLRATIHHRCLKRPVLSAARGLFSLDIYKYTCCPG